MFAKRSAIQNKFQLAVRTVNAQRYKIRAAIGPELANFLQESANEVCAAPKGKFMTIARHWTPSSQDLMQLRDVALGLLPADLVVKNSRLFCMHTGEIRDVNIALKRGFIAAVAPAEHHFSAEKVVDGQNKYLLPTFIDTHIHIEYSLVSPGEFARCVVPHGTGCVLADPNCVGNVLGGKGMAWAGETNTPLKILQQVSHRIPRAPALELGGAEVTAAEQFDMLEKTNAVSVGESVPFGFDERAADFQSLALGLGKRITGHSARVSHEALWAYAATGVSDDHNAFEVDEILDRLRLGQMITVMSGSMNDNVAPTFADIEVIENSFSQFSFCADDKHVGDLDREGHIDHHIRKAILEGIPILEAYRMATLYAARFYRFDHVLGSISPSKRADFVLINDLENVEIASVWLDGRPVYDADISSSVAFHNSDPIPDWLYGTFNLSESLSKETFRVEASASEGEVAVVAAMEMYDGYFKRAFEAELPVVDGNVLCDPLNDVAKISVIDRHHGSDTSATGFVRGFGLERGALAASTNCENQNLVVIGACEEDMLIAARALQECGGGYVCVDDGEVSALLPLPLAGIMSDQPWEQVVKGVDRVNLAARAMGSKIPAPFMILAFVGLAGVPDYGLTERGLIDSLTQSFIPVVQCCRCPTHVHNHSVTL